MNLIPRWYLRRYNFNKIYKNYEEQLNKFLNSDDTTVESKRILINGIKACFVMYSKTLRDILKAEKNIIEFLPVKILKMAEGSDLKLINDAIIWTEYIETLNELCQSVSIAKDNELINQIFEKYKYCPRNAYENLNKYRTEDYYADTEKIIELDTSGIIEYNCNNIGITELSYNLLIQFFRDRDFIKYVWMHGSRALGNGRKNSDLDLIIDIPTELQEQLYKDAYNLKIPYILEFKNIQENNEKDISYLRKISENAKLIYRKTDFE